MKKIAIITVWIVAGLLYVASVGYAEMAKKGSGSYRSGKNGTFSVLNLGEGRLQMNWDETGVMVDAPENSPFVNTSYRAIGSLHSIDGNWTGNGSIVFTCPNGDQIFGVIENAGVLGEGPRSGGVDLIGGTGGCTGIKGRIDFMPRPEVKPSGKDMYQGIGIGKVSWKIP